MSPILDARSGSERLVILDMDGVITSERGYWDAAACAVVEFLAEMGVPEAAVDLQTVLKSPSAARSWLPDVTIAEVKSLAINTNWDLTFLAAGCHLIDVIAQLKAKGNLKSEMLASEAFWVGRGEQSIDQGLSIRPTLQIVREFFASCRGKRGYELLGHLSTWAEERCGSQITWLDRSGPFWQYLFNSFQCWYLGDALARKTGCEIKKNLSRQGIVFNEPLILPAEAIRDALSSLRSAGFTLAVGTGRLWLELEIPLKAYGLAEFFDRKRVVTHDNVAAAETELRSSGKQLSLSKPHPFCFLRAIYPEVPTADLVDFERQFSQNSNVIIVGDTVGDMSAGKSINATTIAVLTGVAGEKGRSQLIEAGARHVIQDISKLPECLRGIYAS